MFYSYKQLQKEIILPSTKKKKKKKKKKWDLIFLFLISL